MKKEILWLLARKSRAFDAQLKKKIFWAIGIASIFGLAFLGLFGVLLFKAGEVVAVQKNLQDKGRAFTEALSNSSCGSTLTGLVSLDPWLNTPVTKTIESIYEACFKNSQASADTEKGRLI